MVSVPTLRASARLTVFEALPHARQVGEAHAGLDDELPVPHRRGDRRGEGAELHAVRDGGRRGCRDTARAGGRDVRRVRGRRGLRYQAAHRTPDTATAPEVPTASGAPRTPGPPPAPGAGSASGSERGPEPAR